MRRTAANRAKDTAMAAITWMIRSAGPNVEDASQAAGVDSEDINRIFVFSISGLPLHNCCRMITVESV